MRRVSLCVQGVICMVFLVAAQGCNTDLTGLGDGSQSDLDPSETSGGVSGGSGPHIESDGQVVVEAEHFTDEGSDWTGAFGAMVELDSRNWILQESAASGPAPDPDGFHSGASGDAYMECLPDTRVTHDDPMDPGSFYDDGTGGAWLSYDIDFQTTGMYYVWARAYSTGTEDNGLHVGVDGVLADAGRRMQWCGANEWRWSSAQRDTGGTSCGVNGTITIQIDRPGLHEITFYQREDGFEFDRFLLTTNAAYTPQGAGPRESDRTNP
ncbi:MAG: hypothetical protein JSU68_06210 [Phycisphaerales bacterium]|nr:MAG: hypothetical protein JSU68_06210 [Phycisphaerales bacterium]